MGQGRPVRDVAADAVWGEAQAKAGAAWGVNSPRARVETVYAQNAANRCRTLLGNRVVERLVLSVGRE